MAGRTVDKYYRCYIDGFDMSGYGRTIGPMELTYDEADQTTWTDTVKGYLPNHAHVNIGTLNTILEDTATIGVPAVLGTSGVERVVTAALGMRAAPTLGDIVFAGQFTQKAYQSVANGGSVDCTIPFMGWAADASTLNYGCPFGTLLHEMKEETDVNAANGTNWPEGAATAGGYMVCHINALDAGTVTITVQDSVLVGGAYADVGGLTTGAIAAASVPYAVVVPTTLVSTAIRQFARWQLVFAGGASACTFALSLHRK